MLPVAGRQQSESRERLDDSVDILSLVVQRLDTCLLRMQPRALPTPLLSILSSTEFIDARCQVAHDTGPNVLTTHTLPLAAGTVVVAAAAVPRHVLRLAPCAALPRPCPCPFERLLRAADLRQHPHPHTWSSLAEVEVQRPK
jgi:hypothetical protein